MSPVYRVKCSNPACTDYDLEQLCSKAMSEPFPLCDFCKRRLSKVYGKDDGSFTLKGDCWYRDGYGGNK
jgi:hypothetical protein|uniref:Uncharacterized protein n=1 Tax=uncultured marine virus TaxID=186617 RepID=A0A0F7L317_9VIRU|nr:hypothetical protein [uncultured marine virus]